MITITQNAIYHSTFSLKVTSHDSSDVKEIKSDEIINYFQDTIEIGNDVTFGRLFQMIIDNKEFFDIFYRGLLEDVYIIDFIEEFSKKPSKKNNDYTIIISWGSDYYDTTDSIRSFHDFVQMHGVKTNKIYEKNVEDFIFTLDFTPLNELKNKKIMVSNYFEIVDNSYMIDYFGNMDINEAADINSKIAKHFTADNKEYTVYDIFYCILEHASFYGTPEERDEIKKEIEKNEASAREASSPESFKEQPMTNEEYQKRLENSIREENERFKKLKTFWEVLYPNDKTMIDFKNNIDPFESAALMIAQTVGLSIEDQIKEAVNNEEYEKAEKLNRLLNKTKNK